MTLLLLCLLAPADEPARYARPELLAEAVDLAKGKAVVLDARTRAKYDAGHVPGAVHVDAEAWAKAFASGQDKGAWARRVGGLGIDTGTPVVVYDDTITGAARVWFILRYFGVKDVRLLNGGWSAWQRSGAEVSKEAATPAPKTPTLTTHEERLTTKGALLELLKKPERQIVDTRSRGEFCGEDTKAKRGGSVPGAVHLEWVDLIDRPTQRFKPPAELAKLLRERGVALDRPTVTYCQSGGRASVMVFALELMGGKDVSNYYRSWAEWGNAEDTPVVTPPKK